MLVPSTLPPDYKKKKEKQIKKKKEQRIKKQNEKKGKKERLIHKCIMANTRNN